MPNDKVVEHCAEKPTVPEIVRAKAKTACKECQRRRIKCKDGYPCSECTKHNRACFFDPYSDKRRKIFGDKIQEELSFYQECTDQLLEAIRVCDQDEVQHIVNVIRSGSSIEDIRITVAQLLNLDRSAQTIFELAESISITL